MRTQGVRKWQPGALEWTENDLLSDGVVVPAKGEVHAVLRVLEGAED